MVYPIINDQCSTSLPDCYKINVISPGTLEVSQSLGRWEKVSLLNDIIVNVALHSCPTCCLGYHTVSMYVNAATLTTQATNRRQCMDADEMWSIVSNNAEQWGNIHFMPIQAYTRVHQCTFNLRRTHSYDSCHTDFSPQWSSNISEINLRIMQSYVSLQDHMTSICSVSALMSISMLSFFLSPSGEFSTFKH